MDGLACMESQCAGFAMTSLSISDFDPALFFLPLQWNDFCGACDRDCTMQVVGVGPDGLNVECTGCGDKRTVRFTRETS